MPRLRLIPAALVLAVTTLVPLASPALAAPVVLSKWKFDEVTAGVTAADQSGVNPGTPGSVLGLTLPTPSTDVAPVSYANDRSLDFNGDNYVEVGNPVALAGDFSVCAWIKTTSPGGGANHWESAPILDAESAGVDYDFGFGIGNGGRLIYGNGGLDANAVLVDSQVNGTVPVNDGQWHNVCATRDDTTGSVSLYVDAQLDGQGVTGTGPLGSNPRARVGWGFDNAEKYVGLVDEVAIFDSALTQAQLVNLRDGSEDPDAVPALPTVSVTVPGAGAVVGAWAPAVDWGASATCEYSWDASTWTAASCAAAGADIPAPGDGTHQLSLRGRIAGVLWSPTVTQSFTLDETRPVVDAGADRRAKDLPTLGDAAASDATAGVASYAWSMLSGPGSVTFSDPAVPHPALTAVSRDGTYVLRLSVTDLAGNTAHDDLTLVWDTTRPGLAVRSAPEALTRETTARFAFGVDESVSNPSVVQCSLDGATFAACADTAIYHGLADGDHTWRLRAADAVGNRRALDVLRWVVDTTAPSVTLVGPASVEVVAGSAYVDQGATATDSREGDLSSAVTRDGRVDTAAPGRYVLTYGVRDAAGNVASPVTRTVTVTAVEEDEQPDGRDRNGDGLPDLLQANISTMPSSVAGGAQVTLALDEACTLTSSSVRAAGSYAADAGYRYPYGLVGFAADCGEPGYTTTVEQFYPDTDPSDLVLRKFIGGGYVEVAGATIERTRVGGAMMLVATYQVTDGGELDVDGVVNGVIVDPAGLALVATSMLSATEDDGTDGTDGAGATDSERPGAEEIDEEVTSRTEAAPATGLRRTGIGADVGSILAGTLLMLGALLVSSRRRRGYA